MTRRARERALGVLLAALALALALAALDASTRTRTRGSDLAMMSRVAEATGLSDLALSSSSRWLRHPSLAEPNAALWDAPLGLDVDPAGASIRRPLR